MYELSKPKPDQLTFRLQGEVDANEMKTLLDEFFAMAEGLSNAKLLYIVDKVALPSLAAVGVELTRLPKLIKVSSNFSRCAVVADQDWVKVASEIQGKMWPGMTLETFEPHETSVAQTWLDAPAG